jgi:predicted ATPase/class 3 adenylate cyclase
MRATGTAPPTGTVTFLFTDIEGSTRLLQALGDRYEPLLEQHRALCRAAFAAGGGVEIGTEGDAFFIAFPSAQGAIAAVVNAQRALWAHSWPDDARIRVRMGLHTGEAAVVAGDYVGLDVHRAARIASCAHGGQAVLSEPTRALVAHALPEGVTLRDLGEHLLKDLLRPERLHQIVIDGVPAEFPSLRTVDARPNNLPVQLTNFIGRAREVQEARRLLATTRLLTLTGPGGTGKTRLSLEVGAQLIDDFRDGVFFVPLSALSDPALVAPTISQHLGVYETGGRPPMERLIDHLMDRELLLVLDNFEQILGAAPVVSEILRACPRVKAIATSRAALRVYGEQEMPVPPLALPDLDHLPSPDALSMYEAVQLFIQRAVAAKPDFTVNNDNAAAIAEITSRLDGLPLAIELAAARVRLLPPKAMLARLQRRLDIGTSGARDLPARQQTLRGAIAWSYDLLGEDLRIVFQRFGAFVRGAGLEAAEEVCGDPEGGADVLEALSALVDHSLVRQMDVDGAPRFTMLSTIREFAVERLTASGEAAAVRDRHAGVYARLAREAAPNLTGPRQKEWLDRLEHDHDNVRAALGWYAESNQLPAALRLAASLWRFWQMRGHLPEAQGWFERLLAAPGAEADRGAWADAQEAAGGIAYWQGDFPRARGHYERDLAARREIGDRRGIANALYNISFTVIGNQITLAEGARMLEEALAIYRELNDRPGIAKSLWARTNTFFFQGQYREARAPLDEATAMFRALDDRFGLGWSLHFQGLVGTKLGEFDTAKRALVEALELFASARDVSGVALVIDDFSGLANAMGLAEEAARLAGGAAALQAAGGADLAEALNEIIGRVRPGARVEDEPAIAAAYAEGRAMDYEKIVAYARTCLPERLGSA